jgi:hypothetical protein
MNLENIKKRFEEAGFGRVNCWTHDQGTTVDCYSGDQRRGVLIVPGGDVEKAVSVMQSGFARENLDPAG